MTDFATQHLPERPDVVAPDGSDVRVLLSTAGGSMAHFTLAPGQVSAAVEHRSVEEIWYVVGGAGQMWRQQGQRTEVTELIAGMCVTIPLETRFQFRCTGSSPLQAVAVTMPPWPGPDEAFPVAGAWESPGA